MSGSMVRVEGFRELDEALAKLPAAFRREVLLKALGKAARPIIQEARARARRQVNPRRRGGVKVGSSMSTKWGLQKAMADSIKASAVKADARFPNEVAVKVGPDKGHFYGLFVEQGTKASGPQGAVTRAAVLRRSKKTGKLKLGVRRARKARKGHPATPAFPFLQPAFELNAERTVVATGAEIWGALREKSNALARGAAKGNLSKKAREALLG